MTERSFERDRTGSFGALLVGYGGYYLCRQNLPAAIPEMSRALAIDAKDLGWVVSAGTLAYALGKITTGSLADAKGGRYVFFLGLIGSVVASVLLPLGGSLLWFGAFWSINLYCQSMGWGGLVNVVARWYEKRHYGTAMGVMSLSYQFGGVVALLFAGYLLGTFHDWRVLFLLPSGVLAVVGLATHFLIADSPESRGHPPLTDGSVSKTAGDEAPTTYLARVATVLSDRLFLVTCGLSFVLTLLRTCFNNWTPTYFNHVGASESTAAFKSAIFPLLGCAGTFVAGWYSDRFLGGRRGPVMAAFLVVTIALLLMLAGLDPIAARLAGTLSRSVLALALIGATGFFLLGSYSLVGGVSALDFGGRRTAGTAAGLLDGAGYLGGTLAGWGAAKLFDSVGWPALYGSMAGLVVVGVALALVTWNVRPK